MHDEQPLLTYSHKTIDHHQTLTLYPNRAHVKGRHILGDVYEYTITLETLTINYQRLKVRASAFKAMVIAFAISALVAIVYHCFADADAESLIGTLLILLTAVLFVGLVMTVRKLTCIQFLSVGGTPLLTLYKARPDGGKFERVVEDMLRLIGQAHATRDEKPGASQSLSGQCAGNEPILTYTDSTIHRRQTIILYPDRIRTTGKVPFDCSYDLTYPLTALSPTPAHVYVRERIFWMFVFCFIISAFALYFYYAVTPAGQPVKSIEYLIPVPGIMLLLAGATFKKKHIVAFHSMHGESAFALCQGRQTADQFKELATRISAAIQMARAAGGRHTD